MGPNKQWDDLRIMERKSLRTKLGPKKKTGGKYRQRMNIELLREIKDDIVTKIKQQRSKWVETAWEQLQVQLYIPFHTRIETLGQTQML